MSILDKLTRARRPQATSPAMKRCPERPPRGAHDRRREHLRMLLVEARLGDFINGEIADARATGVITCLEVGSREQVDETVAKAVAGGAKPCKPTVEGGREVRRELPGSRRSRLGADVLGAAVAPVRLPSVGSPFPRTQRGDRRG